MKHEKKQDALMEKLTLAEAGSSTPHREGLSVNGEAIVAFVSISAAYTADPNDVWTPKNSFLLLSA
ncbi:MAG TPA: hypothetical protein VKB36_20920 [Vicinamibacterales bacterium]|nr:hypothetical protein [Vicinamibacterales bacterium]